LGKEEFTSEALEVKAVATKPEDTSEPVNNAMAKAKK
jgi:hypothetical protein